MLKLRDCQESAIQSVLSDFQKPCSVLGVAATGYGKTIITLELAQRILDQSPEHRVLFLAHRRALIQQPLERVGQFWPNLVAKTGIVMADQDQYAKRLIVASVQTLANPKRLSKILSHAPITHVIIDEAHRAAAGTYTGIVDTCRRFHPDLRLLGVTATPERADGKLADVFEKESFVYGTKELIALGHLVKPEIRGIMTSISVADVRVDGSGSGRDYNSKGLAKVFETDNCFELVVESHKEYASGRPGIAFTTSVAGAYRLAELFNESGIPAIALDGTTKEIDRESALERVKSGEILMICNAQLYNEGFDLPLLEVAHLVRPYRQDGPWIQCAGRVLRRSPETGKVGALILDYLPEERTLELSLHKRAARVGQDTVSKSKRGDGDGTGENPFMVPIEIAGTGNGLEYVLLDYFNLGKGKDTAWSESDSGWRIIGLGKGDDGIQRSLAVSPASEQMSLWAIWKRPGDRWNQAAMIESGDCDNVLACSEELIKKHGAKALTGKAAHWRSKPPTVGAQNFGRKLSVFSDGMTGGELSDAINEKLAMQALSRACAGMARA